MDTLPAPLAALLPYLKGIAALIFGIGTAVAGVVALPHVVTAVILAAGVVAVYKIPNLSPVKPGDPAVPAAGDGEPPLSNIRRAIAAADEDFERARVVHDTALAPPVNVTRPPDLPAPPTPQP